MKLLSVRISNDGLYKHMKLECASKGISVQNYIQELIEQDLNEDTIPAEKKTYARNTARAEKAAKVMDEEASPKSVDSNEEKPYVMENCGKGYQKRYLK